MRKLKLLISSLILISLNTFAQEADEFDAIVEKRTENGKGSTGSYGSKLAKLASFVNINGYITTDFLAPQNGDSKFDQHYFNISTTVQLTDKLSAEGMLEYEHAGEDVDVRYVFADYKFSDAFILRTGKFLVPAGEFNEYLYPEYISKTINRAWVNREISPSAWGEVGVQLRGSIKRDGSKLTPFYSLYVVNGLHGDEGAGIRGLRGNNREKGTNGNKAVGGNLGVEIGGLTISTNMYNGKYDDTNKLGLTIMGSSLSYNSDKLTVWGEYQMANQQIFTSTDQTETEPLNKSAFYLLAAYKVYKGLEPVVRYDQIILDGAPEGDRQRITLGINYHISKTAVAKVNYEMISDDGIDEDDNVFGLQLSLGF